MPAPQEPHLPEEQSPPALPAPQVVPHAILLPTERSRARPAPPTTSSTPTPALNALPDQPQLEERLLPAPTAPTVVPPAPPREPQSLARLAP